MGYKIVGDSCCDYTIKEKTQEQFISVPLTIQVDNFNIVDDDTFDQKDFLKKMKESPNCPKSSCPAPETYMNAYALADDIYVVTLSAELSGSYNSAELAKKLYIEEHGSKNIHIFNSRSASSGQLLIARKIDSLAKTGMVFDQVIKEVEDYIQSQSIMFVLETLDVLRKNGRLTRVQALLAGALNIKPVMGATKEGEIVKISQTRGIKKALFKMVDVLGNSTPTPETKDLVIAHCNNYERAVMVKEEFEKLFHFRSIDIIETKGISTLYACDGGIIVSY